MQRTPPGGQITLHRYDPHSGSWSQTAVGGHHSYPYLITSAGGLVVSAGRDMRLLAFDHASGTLLGSVQLPLTIATGVWLDTGILHTGTLHIYGDLPGDRANVPLTRPALRQAACRLLGASVRDPLVVRGTTNDINLRIDTVSFDGSWLTNGVPPWHEP